MANYQYEALCLVVNFGSCIILKMLLVKIFTSIMESGEGIEMPIS